MHTTTGDRTRAAKLSSAKQRKLNEWRDRFYAGYDAANEALAEQFNIGAQVPKDPSDRYKRTREDRFQLWLGEQIIRNGLDKAWLA